jgi:PiT family inorganic phosphate transporter
MGTMLLGASVASTLCKKMIYRAVHTDDPDVVVSGMLMALVSASFMVAVARFFALPISTTHTIISSMGLVFVT